MELEVVKIEKLELVAEEIYHTDICCLFTYLKL